MSFTSLTFIYFPFVFYMVIVSLKIATLSHNMKFPKNGVCATSKASDQPAHMRSLIRAFAGHLNILGLLSY